MEFDDMDNEALKKLLEKAGKFRVEMSESGYLELVLPLQPGDTCPQRIRLPLEEDTK